MQNNFPILRQPHEIGDFNSEGFDSVDSEDFDPGFGCVPEKMDSNVCPPAPILIYGKQKREPKTALGYFLNDAEILKQKFGKAKYYENLKYDSLTGSEKDTMNNEQLNKMGL